MLRKLLIRILIIAIAACIALVAGSKGNFAVFWITVAIMLFMPVLLLSLSIVKTLEGSKDAFDIGLEILAVAISFIIYIFVSNVYGTEAHNALIDWMFKDEPGPIVWNLENEEAETTDTEVENTTNETEETATSE